MKQLIEYIEEGLLSGMDDVMRQGDDIEDMMHLFHWKYGGMFKKVVHKVVPGGLIGGVFMKYFPKKPVAIKTNWTKEPLSVTCGNTKMYTYTKYDADYLQAMILNTRLPKPITEYNLSNFKDALEVKNAIEEHIRSYMLDDARKYRSQKNNWPLMTVQLYPGLDKLKMYVYLHQDDFEHESRLLCDLYFKIAK